MTNFKATTPTPPPTRKVHNSKTIEEGAAPSTVEYVGNNNKAITSEDKWQFSKLSFIIGVLITASLFKVFGG